jgi:hypothetical protein
LFSLERTPQFGPYSADRKAGEVSRRAAERVLSIFRSESGT